jgi:hypothetical protein
MGAVETAKTCLNIEYEGHRLVICLTPYGWPFVASGATICHLDFLNGTHRGHGDFAAIRRALYSRYQLRKVSLLLRVAP